MGLQLLRTLPTYLLKLNLLRVGFSLAFGVALTPSIAEAQVVPDGTLKSTVETIQELMKIDGGLTEGSNLFHSFEEFNIPEGMEASFENAVEIENIFTRVTGDSASTINGTLSAQGGANLFLMNPNGIVFGQDASINIGGSFIATTADNIQFQDGTEFAATSTEDQTPLLTNEIPIGLGFGSQKSGEIAVNGAGNEITPTSPLSPTQIENSDRGLELSSGNTLGLVGSGVTVDGGTLFTDNGNIEIGSVGSGVVTIQPTNRGFAFDYSNVDYQNIDITNQALINSSGEEVGAISLTGSDITFSEGSLALLQSQGTSSSENINLTASKSLVLSGVSSDSQTASNISTEATEAGEGGDIVISTPALSLLDGALISNYSFGTASGGDIVIITQDSVELSNSNLFSTLGFGVAANTFGSGNAGNVSISSQEVGISDGGSISSSTFGEGNSGTVNVDAQSISINGAASAGESGVQPSQITSSTVGTGDGGAIEVNTERLEIADGGRIFASSFSDGNAGSIIVNATSSIDVSGEDATQTQQSLIGSSIVVSPAFQEALGISTTPGGAAGNVTVNTSILNIVQRGELSVENEGTGSAGTVIVNASNINLDDAGSIAATSASGTGGNIEFTTNSLQIDSDSTISAAAENQGGGGNININATNITAKKNSDISANAEGGDGGNITIDTETLLGLDNSDITANAVEGDGGNINITATSILGYEERPELTPLSDITASSEFGVDGTININSPETNAEEDVQVSAKKPVAPLTPLEIVKGCQLPEGILTTRGRGVPESPYPFPFGYLSHDESDGDIYQKAKETMRQERQKQQREEQENGISRQEAEERRQARELAMLREKQRLLPNRHEHLMYEVTDDREVGPMLLPAPEGKLVEPADGRTDKNAIPAFYSESNELPPISQEKRLRQEGNVLVINPDGSQHFVRMFLMSHPTEEMCQSTVGSR